MRRFALKSGVVLAVALGGVAGAGAAPKVEAGAGVVVLAGSEATPSERLKGKRKAGEATRGHQCSEGR